MVPGRMPRRSLLRLAGGAAFGALVPERLAAAAPMSGDELRRLQRGGPVHVPLDLDLPQGFYFGGIVYLLVHFSAEEVMALAGDPGNYTQILVKTTEARVLARRGRDMQVYLRQGEGRGSVSYVLLMRREAPGLLRFWLDPSQPHDLDDGWGFLRVEPKPRTWVTGAAPLERRFQGAPMRPPEFALITWAVLLRIDWEELRLRYSESLRASALAMPYQIRKCLHMRSRDLPCPP